MKIGILTLHRVRNYGSVLQAFALCKALSEAGYTVEVIDYIPERFRLRSDLFFVRADRYTSENGKINYAKKIVFQILSVLPRLYYYTRFSGFVKKYIPLSKKKYFNVEDLQDERFDYDIYINGSDQVWNMAWERDVDRSFFLDFVPDGKVKGAYAASFGKTEISESEREIMKPLLKEYSFITVRESSGVEVLKSMEIDDGIHVLDPTLLYSAWGGDWSGVTAKRRVKGRYILIYQLNHSTPAIQYARKIADCLGLKVVELSRKARTSPMVDVNLPFVKPQEFLSAFCYADYIVTDSFHGTAFSINYNKQFISIRNDFPERAGDLLHTVGLDSRFVPMDGELDIEVALSKIEYESVNEVLERERVKARKIINDIGGTFYDKDNSNVDMLQQKR